MKIPKAKAIAFELHDLARRITAAKLSENQRYTAMQNVQSLKRQLAGIISVSKEVRPKIVKGPRPSAVQAMQDTHDEPIAPPPQKMGPRHITDRNPDRLLPEVEEEEEEVVVLDEYRVTPAPESPADTEPKEPA